jgi:hypothetical protein
LARQGDGKVRFSRIEFLDRNGSKVTNPRVGDELVIKLHLEGALRDPKPCRVGITFHDAAGGALFLCASDTSNREPVYVGAEDTVMCRVPRLPLSAGRYSVTLFLERGGIIEDWIQDNILFDVVDGSYFGTSRNLPPGWEGKTVLVDHHWSVLRGETREGVKAQEAL